VTPLVVAVAPHAGSFAENKDKARLLRQEILQPALESGQAVVVDFEGVEFATQSFVHALIAQPIRLLGADVLEERLAFRNCSEAVVGIIEIVVSYCQDE
jgi:anti-anti-sigma regulatory factor